MRCQAADATVAVLMRLSRAASLAVRPKIANTGMASGFKPVILAKVPPSIPAYDIWSI